MSSNTKQQAEIAERLQLRMLEHFESLFESGEITSTDLATLYRILRDNGWTFDESKLPTSLKDKLTKHVRPEDLEDDDFLPFPKAV